VIEVSKGTSAKYPALLVTTYEETAVRHEGSARLPAAAPGAADVALPLSAKVPSSLNWLSRTEPVQTVPGVQEDCFVRYRIVSGLEPVQVSVARGRRMEMLLMVSGKRPKLVTSCKAS
jgi:hypothetical protein